MLEFVINYWYIFVIIAVVLLLGLFGYIMDRKKYDEYKQEILSGGGDTNSLSEQKNIAGVADIVDQKKK